MFLNNLKDSWNDYTVNAYTGTAEDYPSKINLYMPGEGFGTAKEDQAAAQDPETAAWSAHNLAVCIGDRESSLMEAVQEWVVCTKRDMAVCPSLEEYRRTAEKELLPELLVLDSSGVRWSEEEEIRFLRECVEKGVHLVFATLPEPEVIKSSRQIRELLGIRKVLEEETAVEGLHLAGGFLLGGEVIYSQEEYPDMNYTFPWYLPGTGTKVYMKGIPDIEDMKTDSYPLVIWRKSFGTAYVFAVNGGYMDEMTAHGILSAISSEMYSYEVYPIVNAQSMVLAGFPGLADENAEALDKLYSRPLKQIFQEVLWPGIVMTFRPYRYKATCMMTPQYDYTDENLPDEKQLQYYLKIFHEQGAEVGLDIRSRSDTPMEQKLREDQAFLEKAVDGYEFVSFYGGDLSLEKMQEVLQGELLSGVKTVVADVREKEPGIIGFLTDDITIQRGFQDGLAYKNQRDFLVRTQETALGYFSMIFDMTQVAYPEEEGEGWEKLSSYFASAVASYGRLFQDFDRTTAAECDARIRNLLALDYEDSRQGDRIFLKVWGGKGNAWFILRTHNEAVRSVEGGSFKRLEEGAFLVTAQSQDVVITLEPADSRHYR